MKRQLSTLLVMATLAIGGGNAFAAVEVWTFSDGNAYDTMIARARVMTGQYKYDGDLSNYGALDWFGVNESADTRSLLRFDVSSLPGDYVTVESITLRLYQSDANVTDLSLFQMTPGNSDWQEGWDTGSVFPWPGSRTSWHYCLWKDYYELWEGGPGVGNWGPLLSSTAATSGGGWTELTFTGDVTALMDAWVQNPVAGSYGSFVTGGGTGVALNEGMLLQGNGAEFYSSNNANGLGPQLVVTVVVPDPPPGDFNEDYDVDAEDIDILCDNMASLDPKFDLDDGTGSGEPDGDVDEDDLIYLIETLAEWDNGVDSGTGTKQGDFNLDGVVNATDLAIMKGTFGASGVIYADGNANCDDVVNATDLAILKGSFGFVAPTGGGVPEPVTIALLSLGGLGLLRGRRR